MDAIKQLLQCKYLDARGAFATSDALFRKVIATKMHSELIQKSLNLFHFIPNLWAVGGCVRDLVLGKQPDDIDFCTLTPAEEVIRLCNENDIPVNQAKVNLEHGTVFVRLNNQEYEITTFRIDEEHYGHKTKVKRIVVDDPNDPAQVLEALHQDLSRRDFTINSMAIGRDGEVVDPFGGQQDLANRLIKCVGDPGTRFSEDLLRIIRGARFAGRYGFKIEPETWQAMQEYTPVLVDSLVYGETKAEKGQIHINRIRDEIDKAFHDDKPSGFLQTLWDLGLIQQIIPELSGMDTLMQNPKHHPEGSVWKHLLEVVDRAPQSQKDNQEENKEDVRWDAFLHDIGKASTAKMVEGQQWNTFHGHEDATDVIDQIGARLNMPERLINDIKSTTALHMRPLSLLKENATEGSPHRRFHRDIRGEREPQDAERIRKRLLALHMADIGGRHQVDERLEALFTPPVNFPIGNKADVIGGRDILSRPYLGLKPGPDFKKLIRAANEVYLETGLTDADELIVRAWPIAFGGTAPTP